MQRIIHREKEFLFIATCWIRVRRLVVIIAVSATIPAFEIVAAVVVAVVVTVWIWALACIGLHCRLSVSSRIPLYRCGGVNFATLLAIVRSRTIRSAVVSVAVVTALSVWTLLATLIVARCVTARILSLLGRFTFALRLTIVSVRRCAVLFLSLVFATRILIRLITALLFLLLFLVEAGQTILTDHILVIDWLSNLFSGILQQGVHLDALLVERHDLLHSLDRDRGDV